MQKQFLSMALSFSLFFLTAICLYSCENQSDQSYVQPTEQDLGENTELYEQNGMLVCDTNKSTESIADDCDGTAQGYFYNPDTYNSYYRGNDGSLIYISRQRFFTHPVGGYVGLSRPVITSSFGVPLMADNKAITRPLGAGEKGGTVTKAPVRTSSSFDHPALGKVSSGKVSASSVSRGVSFGSRSGGAG
jgi:hypothetical protein